MLTADAEHLVVDEVMKRRLVVDGEGSGDEGRIVDAVKSFLIWCKGVDRSVSYATVNRQLFRIKHDNQRTHAAILLHEVSRKEYCLEKEKVKERVDKAKEELENLRKSLEKARESQQNSQECHALVKLIMTKADRSEMEDKKAVLEEELNALQSEKDSLESLLERLTKSAKDFCTSGQNLLDQFDEEYQKYASFIENSFKVR